MYSPPVSQEVLEKAAAAGRRLRVLATVQLVWLVLSIVGGVLLVVTLARNGSADLSNCGASLVDRGNCGGHHSYAVPASLLALGIAGFVANGYLMAWLARRYLGQAARFLFGAGQRRSATTVIVGEPIRSDPRPPGR
jgi:hypothetical protein